MLLEIDVGVVFVFVSSVLTEKFRWCLSLTSRLIESVWFEKFSAVVEFLKTRASLLDDVVGLG